MKKTFTQDEIKVIVNQENLVLRNLQVTQGYYHLAMGLRKYMSNKNVNWLGFATHASKTAGQALRHELMPRSIKSAMIRSAGYKNTYVYLNNALGEASQSMTNEHNSLLAEALKKVSLLISAGNILVFNELAWPFSRLINHFSTEWKPDDVKFQAFLGEFLRPGAVEDNGQDHLFESMTAFYNARFETNNKRKAELIFQGNLLIGLHEQTRLQSYIEDALAVPYDIFIDGSLPGDSEKKKGLGDRIRNQTKGLTRELVVKAATRMWMQFSLPSQDLKLGQNVVAPTGIYNFPSDLMTIQEPGCLELVRQFDVGMDTLSGSAADNWGRLSDRMSFVVDFFRSHQQNKHLFEAPFLEEQVAAIDAGYMPAGPL